MFMDADGSEEVGEPVVITADVRRVMMLVAPVVLSWRVRGSEC